jgi:hypothetical protein
MTEHDTQERAPSDAEDELTVTGPLVQINFDDRSIAIRYPPTNQELRCSYDRDQEDRLIEHRRELVQVTGRFEQGADGHPVKCLAASRIDFLDLSPMALETIDRGDRVLVLRPALVLQPTLDESQQLLVVDDEGLNMHLFEYTREALVEEIASSLFFLWDEYAQAAPEKLSPAAQRLREVLLQRMRVSAHATT